MAEFLDFVRLHWPEWLFTLVSGALALGYRSVSTRLKAETAKNQAIAEGVQSLLRESIVDAYNKYSEKGFCPIYAKESIKRAFTSYTRLGGNDVAKELYHKLLQMDEEKGGQT